MRFDFPKNVAFECSRCGLCCGDTSAKKRHILLLKADAERLTSFLNRGISTFSVKTSDKHSYIYEMQKSPDGKCILLNNNQCSAYEARPLICRFYPFELSSRADGSYSFQATEECPGVIRCDDLSCDKKLVDAKYFKKLLELAKVEFNERKN